MTKPSDISKGPLGFSLQRFDFAANAGLFAFIVLLAIGIGLSAPSFVSPFNIFALSRNLAVDAVVGLSMMVVLSLGHMNLAVGSIGVCAVMFFGFIMQTLGIPVWLAVPLTLAAGAAMGAFNGVLIIVTQINSFIVTLATASLLYGSMLILTKANPFLDLPEAVSAFGTSRTWFISNMLVVTLGVLVLLMILFRNTTLGRQILATGANPVAASASGIHVERIVVVAHALSGALAAVAAMLLTARLGSALPSVAQDWLLPAFLAPLLGGTLLAGGHVAIVGTFLGATLIAIIQNGLVLTDISGFWIQFFLGLTLLAVVLGDKFRTNRALKRAAGGGGAS